MLTLRVPRPHRRTTWPAWPLWCEPSRLPRPCVCVSVVPLPTEGGRGQVDGARDRKLRVNKIQVVGLRVTRDALVEAVLQDVLHAQACPPCPPTQGDRPVLTT
jgi:hypothetical protein